MEQRKRPENAVITKEAGSENLKGTAFLLQTPRLLLYPLIIIVQLAASAVGGIGFVSGNPPALLLTGAFLWLVWFFGLFVLALNPTDHILSGQAKQLRKAGIITVSALLVLVVLEGAFVIARYSGVKFTGVLHELDQTFIYNDATALCHQATENLLHGENPYASGNIVKAIEEYGGASDRITPRREGIFTSVFPYPTEAEMKEAWQKALDNPTLSTPEIETRMNYPAGSFELPALFMWLGIKDIRLVYLIFVVLALGGVIRLTPKQFRWPLVSVIIVGLAFWNSIAGGETGSLAFPFMLLGWVLFRKGPWASAILMGIAMSVKQTAFFLVPFYLVLMFHSFGIKKTILVAGTMAGIFLATNLPFIIRDPMLWMNSMGAPMSEDFFPVGAGMVTLITSGLINIQSPAVFTLMEGFVMGVGLTWYFLNCRKYPHTGPILAFFPLFFAWRSLWSYFFYIDIIVVAAVIIDEYGDNLNQFGQIGPISIPANTGGQV
jgi:hypothetical protein